MAETSGVLRPAVEAYLRGGPMDEWDIAAMRAYLRQWIADPTWAMGAAGGSCDLDLLRAWIDSLVDRQTITEWLDFALRIGIDPL